MNIFLGLFCDFYVANFSAKPILFTKNMVAADACRVPNYIVHPRGEEPNPKQQEKNDFCSNSPGITENPCKNENVTKFRREKRWEALESIIKGKRPKF